MSTNNLRTAVTWKAYDSITALPPRFWNKHVARCDPPKCEEFLRLIEKHTPDAKFLCLAAHLDQQIVACALFTLSELDLAARLPPPLRFAVRLVRWGLPRFLMRNVVAAGTEVTDGEHWWYDERYWNWPEFFADLDLQIRRYPSRVDRTVFRSYVLRSGPLPDEVRGVYQAAGFVEGDEMLQAELTLPEHVASEEDYLNALNQRQRYTVRKALRSKDKYGLQYEEIEGFSDMIDEIYPLYLATWENAKELSTHAVTKAFFLDLSRERGLRPSIQVVRDRQGATVAFGLTLENDRELCLWFVGMDYAMNRDMSLIYHVYWQAISHAIRRGIRRIQLGVTTYFVKQKFGAELCPTLRFTRSTSPLLARLRSWQGRRESSPDGG
jgi:hypothetical protein